MTAIIETAEHVQRTAATASRFRVPLLAKLRQKVESSDGLSSLLGVFDQAMISGTNFVTAVVIGRCCGADTLGIYSLIASAMAMIIGVQDQLLTAPYVLYHNRKSRSSLRTYLGSNLLHFTVFAAALWAGMLMGLWMWPASGSTVRPLAVILTLAAPAILLRAWIREIALAHCNVITVTLLDAAVCSTQLLTIFTLFHLDLVNLTTLYSVLGITCAAASLKWMQSERSRFAFSARSVLVDWKRNWRFGRWALATHIAGASTPYLMPWVLFMLHGEQATGLLASCSVIVGIANILLSGMADFLTPRASTAFATGGLAELRRVLRSMGSLTVIAIGTVCLIAACFGQQIIDVLYDGQFSGAGDLVVLLTLSVLANAVGNVAGNGLWAIDQPRANFVADMLTLTVAVAAAPGLVSPFGAKGAAMATLASCTVGAAFRLLIFHSVAREIDRSETRKSGKSDGCERC